MLKSALLVTAGILVGVGASAVLAETNAPYYEIGEINVKDVDAYKKEMAVSSGLIKNNGGVYVAGGFDKATTRIGAPVANRVVVIRYPSKAAADKVYDDGLRAWIEKNAAVADFRIITVEGVEAK